MIIGIIGMGKMGSAIAYRLQQKKFTVLGYDPYIADDKAFEYSTRVDSLEALARQTTLFWLMIPQGKPIDILLAQMKPLLKPGSIIIDGGNSHFSDSQRHAKELAAQGSYFIDCGTSGGLAGRERGFALMVGGDKQIVEKLTPVFEAIAAPEGFFYAGPSGAGHYVKMVHNGIEYALLQSYAEGFDLLKNNKNFADLDLEKVSTCWMHGSIIRSYILELMNAIFKRDQEFANVEGSIQENLTGRWTLDEARNNNIPVKLIEEALEVRAWSRATGGNYATKLIALTRHEFGGHAVITKNKEDS